MQERAVSRAHPRRARLGHAAPASACRRTHFSMGRQVQVRVQVEAEAELHGEAPPALRSMMRETTEYLVPGGSSCWRLLRVVVCTSTAKSTRSKKWGDRRSCREGRRPAAITHSRQ